MRPVAPQATGDHDQERAVRRFVAFAAVWLAATAAASVALAVVGCGTPGSGNGARITSVTSRTDRDSATAIRVAFDRPMVDSSRVGKPLDRSPVTLRPAVPVRAHWLDAHTLALTAKPKLTASTRYRVMLRGDRSEPAAEFVHAPLVVEGVWGVDLTRLPQRPRLPLHFNQAVSGEHVARRCHLRGKHDATVTALRAAATSADNTRVTLVPDTKLDRGASYVLMCASLRGANGDVPIASPYVLEMTTHPAFSVVGAVPRDAVIPAGTATVELTFSTPVTVDALRTHLRARPSLPGLGDGRLDATGTRYATTVHAAPKTRYRIGLDSELRDAFGQQLGRAHRFEFETQAADAAGSSSNVVASDLAVLVKSYGRSTVAWVTRISSGTPVAGARIALRTADGRVEQLGATDRNGLLQREQRLAALAASPGRTVEVVVTTRRETTSTIVRPTVPTRVDRPPAALTSGGLTLGVTTPARHIKLGAKLSASVFVRTRARGPAANTAVEWTVHRRPHRHGFTHHRDYGFAMSPGRGTTRGVGMLVADGKGMTDARGNLDIALRDPSPNLHGAYDYVVRVSVDDPQRGITSRTLTISAHTSDLYLGLRARELVRTQGQPFVVDAVALTPEGRSISSRATFELLRVVRDCTGVRANGAAGCRVTRQRVASVDGEIGMTGTAEVKLGGTAPGEYLIRVTTTDRAGKRVASAARAWLLGTRAAPGRTSASPSVPLIASRRVLRSGEPARVVVPSNGHRRAVLVAFPRGDRLVARVHRLRADEEVLPVTLDRAQPGAVTATFAIAGERYGAHLRGIRVQQVELEIAER